MARCFCGCGQKVRFTKKRVSAAGWEVDQVNSYLSEEVAQGAPSDRKVAESMLAEGQDIRSDLMAIIHGDAVSPDLIGMMDEIEQWASRAGQLRNRAELHQAMGPLATTAQDHLDSLRQPPPS